MIPAGSTSFLISARTRPDVIGACSLENCSLSERVISLSLVASSWKNLVVEGQQQELFCCAFDPCVWPFVVGFAELIGVK